MSDCNDFNHISNITYLGYCPICSNKETSTKQLDFFGESIIKSDVKCECGAESTLNPDCHAFYCPKYKKGGK